jgi:hypothetical protein
MADKQISDLTSASAMTDGSLFVIEQGGAAKSANWGMIKNYISPGVAAQYSSSATYDVGDYVIYNGQLYRCTTAITTAESWTAAHWTAAVLGDDVVDDVGELKTKITKTYDCLNSGEYSYTGIAFELGKGILISDGSLANLGNYTTWGATDFLPIVDGTKVIESNAVGASADYGYAFYDENKQFIIGSIDGNYNTFVVNVRPSYKYIRFTSYKENSDHSGVYLKGYCFNSLDYLADGLEVIGNGSVNLNNIPFTDEGAINAATGNRDALTGYHTWASSNLIKIPIGTYKASSNAAGGSNDYGIAFYDEDGIFITGIGIISNGFNVNVLPSYKYMRFTDYKANGDHSGVYLKFDGNKYGLHNEVSATLESVITDATLLKGNYTLNSAILLAENQHLKGSNCIITVGENGRLVMNNGSSIEGIKFIGGWNPTRTAGDGTTYTSYGYVPLISYTDLETANSDALFGENKDYTNAVVYIQENMAYNATVKNCIFEGFDRLAVYAGGEHHNEKNNSVVCNNYFTDCRMGVYIGGEFARVYGNEYLRCLVGCYLLGGNSNNFGEIYKCCDCAYYFPITTGNTAHNEITSCEAAHCGLAGIYLQNLSANLGCQVTGCHFPDSPIVGLSVNNLSFVGCRLDTWFKYNSGKGNSIICSNVGKSYLYGHELYDVPQDTLITLNRGLGTTADSEVNA